MPRATPDMQRRTITVETQRRSIDLPVDGAGRVRRHLALDARSHEVRADGESIGFKGKFIPFGQRQWIGSKRWGFWEVNEAGSISKTIREKKAENNDITFNRDHDNKLLLARTSNDTLRPTADDQYGWAEADMGPYSYAHDIAIALERRDLTGMSYAFDMVTWEWSIAEDGNDLLTHREMELFDIAVVGMPANVDTDASLRMDLLQVARSAGFDAMSFDTLARRLADPDPDLIATLRTLGRGPGGDQNPAPVRSTQDLTGLAEQIVETAPPATTTGPNPGDRMRDLRAADITRQLSTR
jgi:HK97 family phage prohead protease